MGESFTNAEFPFVGGLIEGEGLSYLSERGSIIREKRVARESTLGPSISVFTVSLVLGGVNEMQAVEVTLSYPKYKVPKFHTNSRTLSSTTARPVLPIL